MLIIIKNDGKKIGKSSNPIVLLLTLQFYLKFLLTLFQIPKFTGGSHLRHHGLGDAALLFLELDVVFKPELDHGLILYNGDTPSTGKFF